MTRGAVYHHYRNKAGLLAAVVAALGQEAASIPYADSLRRMAEVQSLPSVADLFETAPAHKEFDEDAAARADACPRPRPCGTRGPAGV